MEGLAQPAHRLARCRGWKDGRERRVSRTSVSSCPLAQHRRHRWCLTCHLRVARGADSPAKDLVTRAKQVPLNHALNRGKRKHREGVWPGGGGPAGPGLGQDQRSGPAAGGRGGGQDAGEAGVGRVGPSASLSSSPARPPRVRHLEGPSCSCGSRRVGDGGYIVRRSPRRLSEEAGQEAAVSLRGEACGPSWLAVRTREEIPGPPVTWARPPASCGLGRATLSPAASVLGPRE